MTNTLTRNEELRIDIENISFSIRYLIGVLAELEELGRTHTAEFKRIEKNVNVLKHNKRKLEEKLELAETEWFENQIEAAAF